MAARVSNVSSVVRVGGAVLGCFAGIMNSVAFHAFGTLVSHPTGSLFKVALGWHDSSLDTGGAVLLFLSFELGAGLCGCRVAHDTINIGLALYDL